MTISSPVAPQDPQDDSSGPDGPTRCTPRGLPIRRPCPYPATAPTTRSTTCECNGPCMCAAPVPLLRWFAAQVAVYHGPTPGQESRGQCGQSLRSCGMCMLVASLYRSINERWQGILP